MRDWDCITAEFEPQKFKVKSIFNQIQKKVLEDEEFLFYIL